MKDIDETKAPLLDHLIELRKRLLYCVYALLVTGAVCYYFSSELLAFLVALVTAGPVPALIVAAVAIIVQQLDNDLLAPWIYGKSLSLHPAVRSSFQVNSGDSGHVVSVCG